MTKNKRYMLYYQGKLLDEFEAKDYAEAKIKALDIFSIEEVEDEGEE